MMANRTDKEIMNVANNLETTSFQGSTSKESYYASIKSQGAEILKRANVNNNGGNHNGNNNSNNNIDNINSNGLNVNMGNNNNSNGSMNSNMNNMMLQNNMSANGMTMNQLLAQQARNQMINNGNNNNNNNNGNSGNTNGNNGMGFNNSNNNGNRPVAATPNEQREALFRHVQNLAMRMILPASITTLPNFPPSITKWSEAFEPANRPLLGNFGNALKQGFRDFCHAIIRKYPALAQEMVKGKNDASNHNNNNNNNNNNSTNANHNNTNNNTNNNGNPGNITADVNNGNFNTMSNDLSRRNGFNDPQQLAEGPSNMKQNAPQRSNLNEEHRAILQKCFEEVQNYEKLGKLPANATHELKVKFAKQLAIEKITKLQMQQQLQLKNNQLNNNNSNGDNNSMNMFNNNDLLFGKQQQMNQMGNANLMGGNTETVNPSNGGVGGAVNQQHVQYRLEQQKKQQMNSNAGSKNNSNSNMIQSPYQRNVQLNNVSASSTPVPNPATPLIPNQNLNGGQNVGNSSSPMVNNLSPMMNNGGLAPSFLPLLNSAQLMMNPRVNNNGSNNMNNGANNPNFNSTINNTTNTSNASNNIGGLDPSALNSYYQLFKRFAAQVQAEFKNTTSFNNVTPSLTQQQKAEINSAFGETVNWIKMLDKFAFQFFAMLNEPESSRKLLEIKYKVLKAMDYLKTGVYVMTIDEFSLLRSTMVKHLHAFKQRYSQLRPTNGDGNLMGQNGANGNQSGNQLAANRFSQQAAAQTANMNNNNGNNNNASLQQTQAQFNAQLQRRQLAAQQHQLLGQGNMPAQKNMVPLPNTVTPQLPNQSMGGMASNSMAQVPGASQFRPQQPMNAQNINMQQFNSQNMAGGMALGVGNNGFVQMPNSMMMPGQPDAMAQQVPSPGRIIQGQPIHQGQQFNLGNMNAMNAMNVGMPMNNNSTTPTSATFKKQAPPKRKGSVKATPKMSSPQPTNKLVPKINAINTPSEFGLTPTPSNLLLNNNLSAKGMANKSPIAIIEETDSKNEVKAKGLAKSERVKLIESQPEKFFLSSLANTLELNEDFVDFNIGLAENKDNEGALKAIKLEFEEKHRHDDVKTPKIPANISLIMSPKQSPNIVKNNNSEDLTGPDSEGIEWTAKVQPRAIRSKFKEVPSISDSLLPTMPTPPQDDKTVKESVKRPAAQDNEDSFDGNKRVKVEGEEGGTNGNEASDTFDFDSIFNFDGDEEATTNDELFGLF